MQVKKCRARGYRFLRRPFAACVGYALPRFLLHLSLAVCLVCPSPRAALADNQVLGLIGEDDREIVPSTKAPWNAVGRINIAGYRRTRHCTGTLVGPDLVVTAAHCLIDRWTGEPFRPDNIHFVAGMERGRFSAHSTARCVRFLGGAPPALASRSETLSRNEAQRDVAVIGLASAMAIKPLALADDITLDDRPKVDHAGYARDRPYVLSATKACRVFDGTGPLWFTNCDTTFGASGGPLFVGKGEEARIAGIMIGFVKGRHSIAIPAPIWHGLVDAGMC